MQQAPYTHQVIGGRSPKDALVRATARFAGVITELEQDLDRMQKNDKLSAEFIALKDAQIETLVGYQNQVDELVGSYETQLRLLRIQNRILEDALASRINSDESFTSYFLNLFRQQ